MKIHNWILLVLLFLACTLGGLWLYSNYRHDLSEQERFTMVSQVLTGTYNQSRIQSADAFYQVIFPFDFLPSEGMAWKNLRAQALAGKPIPPNDWETLELVRLARKIGFDPDKEKYSFIVLNIRVRAGIDLERYPMVAEVQMGPKGRLLNLTVPSPGVTDFLVTDLPEGMRFPSPVLSPLDWKLLVEKLKPRVLIRVINEGLLVKAKESAQKIFERILTSSGITQYEIHWNASGESPAGKRE